MEKQIIDDSQHGTIEDVQIAPAGEFTGSAADGSPVEEHIDINALQALADKLNAQADEVLLDIDHASCKPGMDRDTQAAGWFSKFFVDPAKGLLGKLKLTKRGRELVEGREYRFLSPVFKLDKSGKPLEMDSVALTNTPAFKGSI